VRTRERRAVERKEKMKSKFDGNRMANKSK
jgi:hypothetical protein